VEPQAFDRREAEEQLVSHGAEHLSRFGTGLDEGREGDRRRRITGEIAWANRERGLLGDMAFTTSRANASGTFAWRARGSGGATSRRATMTAMAVSPSNGSAPVTSSNNVTPRA
jgi:hypothetical protein